ncbi:MAG TPA: TMEM165/GDT1 family protein [Desulfocapsa sulfexigens]|nr:TMEM165/GDT1 family protein [Desulfocapsa sulfexigens]HIQ37447.1 TMEM165/GDT1 family protein [Desulfocapsa sulfexigens]
MKAYIIIFLITFLAEMGDKTQMSTLLFATKNETSRWAVLTAASSALVLATFLAVIVGSELDRFVSVKTIQTVSGIGFILIGVYTLWMVKQS